MWNSYTVHLWTFLFTVTISAEIVLKYHNYEEMTTKLQNLVAKYPDLLSLYQLDGTSIQGNFPFRGHSPITLTSLCLLRWHSAYKF